MQICGISDSPPFLVCANRECNCSASRSEKKGFSPPVVFHAIRTIKRYPLCVLLSVPLHKDLSLKGSEAAGSASHSFSWAFVPGLAQLRL